MGNALPGHGLACEIAVAERHDAHAVRHPDEANHVCKLPSRCCSLHDLAPTTSPHRDRHGCIARCAASRTRSVSGRNRCTPHPTTPPPTHCVMSSSLSFFRIVVLPALSRPRTSTRASLSLRFSLRSMDRRPILTGPNGSKHRTARARPKNRNCATRGMNRDPRARLPGRWRCEHGVTRGNSRKQARWTEFAPVSRRTAVIAIFGFTAYRHAVEADIRVRSRAESRDRSPRANAVESSCAFRFALLCVAQVTPSRSRIGRWRAGWPCPLNLAPL